MKTAPHLPPKIQEITKIPYPEVTHIQLSNGIPVYVIPGTGSDAVKVDFYFDGGAWTASKPLIAHFCNEMLLEGTNRYTGHEIMESFDFQGSYIQPLAEKDMAGLSLMTIERKLNQSLRLVKHILRKSNFPADKLHILTQKKKQQYIIEYEKPKTIARNRMMANLFGENHPYGRIASPEDFDEVTRQDILKHFKENYGSNRLSIFLSGKFNSKTMQLLEKQFGETPWPVNESVLPSYSISPGPAYEMIEKADAVQSAIRIGWQVINRDHADYIGLQILNTVLGGYFGSRLMKNLREDKAYTYGVGSYIQNFRHGSLLAISSEVKKEFRQEAVQEILTEIKSLRAKKIPASELKRVQSYFIGNLLHNFEGPVNASDALKSLWEGGKDFSFVDQIVAETLAMKPATLCELANKYLREETMYQVIAG
ncbi:MAG: insulinase family protein [Bacteroidales bacterium]|nr:insulinase family protein [Bacteroidales bacterium]